MLSAAEALTPFCFAFVDLNSAGIERSVEFRFNRCQNAQMKTIIALDITVEIEADTVIYRLSIQIEDSLFNIDLDALKFFRLKHFLTSSTHSFCASVRQRVLVFCKYDF